MSIKRVLNRIKAIQYGCKTDKLLEKIIKVLSETEIDKIAKDTGFVVNKSKKVNGLNFLRLLLFDQLRYDTPSLQQHLIELRCGDGVSLSKEGLNKRFGEKAPLFISKIFEAYFSRNMGHETITAKYKDHFTSIRILDSTEFKLPDCFAGAFPGYSGSNALACAAIQFEYDLIGREVTSLVPGSANQSDKTFADDQMHKLEKGGLILRDLGYYSLSSYLKVEERGAYYLSRLKSQASIFEMVDGRYVPLPLKNLLKRIEKSKSKCFDGTLYIGFVEKKEVRLMAWLLDEDAQRNRLAKKKSKKGKTNANDVVWSKINVFVTNICQEVLTLQEAYELYKIRWQVELMFKTWKSVLKINNTRKMKVERLKCNLYTKLLWILICWDITSIAEPIVWSKNKKLISLYKCFSILKSRAGEIKDLLFKPCGKLKEWLIKIVGHCEIYGIKENRKGRKNIIEILKYEN